MKRIYDFSRKPAHRNYTVSDLKALKNSNTTKPKLTMSNPANKQEILACIEAGIDLFVIGPRSIQELRSIAPNHFTGLELHGHNLIHMKKLCVMLSMR